MPFHFLGLFFFSVYFLLFLCFSLFCAIVFFSVFIFSSFYFLIFCKFFLFFIFRFYFTFSTFFFLNVFFIILFFVPLIFLLPACLLFCSFLFSRHCNISLSLSLCTCPFHILVYSCGPLHNSLFLNLDWKENRLGVIFIHSFLCFFNSLFSTALYLDMPSIDSFLPQIFLFHLIRSLLRTWYDLYFPCHIFYLILFIYSLIFLSFALLKRVTYSNFLPYIRYHSYLFLFFFSIPAYFRHAVFVIFFIHFLIRILNMLYECFLPLYIFTSLFPPFPV